MANAIKEVKLEKDMYREAQQKGKTLSQFLEELDPTEEYSDSNKELDAFQRQLKRLDIKVKGAGSDVVEKFFDTTDSAVLFPEYISRTVREGLEQVNILPQILATTTTIDGDSYRAIYMDLDKDKKQLKRVPEGGPLPKTSIKTKEHSTTIYKFGRVLEVTYEAIRRKRVDVFAVMLRMIGLQIGKDQLEQAVDVIINGDGNQNAADLFTIGTAPIGGTAGALSYDALIDFWNEFDPYEMNNVLAPKRELADILKLPEFKDPQAGFNFQSTGKIVNPLGATLHRLDSVPAGQVIGMDKRYVLEQVVEQGITIETDKIIDRQLNQTAITQVAGFNKLFADGAKILKK
jgi:HK97 family phage major capsid protein